VQYFKDDATAFNAEKQDVIDGKGVLNNRLSEFFMTGLNARSACRPISSSASTCANN
jgi:phosphoribosylaminoimidazole-succinocarboxamide synthase